MGEGEKEIERANSQWLCSMKQVKNPLLLLLYKRKCGRFGKYVYVFRCEWDVKLLDTEINFLVVASACIMNGKHSRETCFGRRKYAMRKYCKYKIRERITSQGKMVS